MRMLYGIGWDEYNDMLDAQGGTCAICNLKYDKKLAVDHNHTTGKNRGLLCDRCNRGIGLLQDSIDNVERALAYLTEYQ